jgi:arsenate reductase
MIVGTPRICRGYRRGMELWHNPRCSKSRAAKAILDGRSVAYVERRYLEDPPDAATLDATLRGLAKEPWEITRMGEDRAKALGLREKPHDRAEWIATLVENPVLIERPILIGDDGRAVVGRPPEAVTELL